MKGKDFFQNSNGKVLVKVPYLEAYIPEDYYDRRLAEPRGDIINVCGLFHLRQGTSPDKMDSDFRVFEFPAMIATKPNMITKRQVSIRGAAEESYYVYSYYKGDIFMNSNKVVQSLDNVDKFIKMVNSGKLPKDIPYPELLMVYLNALDVNNMDLGISAKIIEFKLAEICRVKGDPDVPFRKGLNSGKKLSDTDYDQINLRYLSMASATFNAVTFEDIDSMILNSVNKKRYNRAEAVSPVEKIIKY